MPIITSTVPMQRAPVPTIIAAFLPVAEGIVSGHIADSAMSPWPLYISYITTMPCAIMVVMCQGVKQSRYLSVD